MIRFLCLLLLVCFSVFKADSYAQSTPNTQIISYHELSQLSAQKRLEYLQGLRSILIDLDKLSPKSKGGLIASIDSQTDIEQESSSDIFKNNLYLILEKLILSAHADSSDLRSQMLVGIPSLTNGQVSCPVGLKAVSIPSSSIEYVCVINKYVGACDDDMVPVSQNNRGLFYCATKTSFLRLSDESKRIARTPNSQMDNRSKALSAASYFARFKNPSEEISSSKKEAFTVRSAAASSACGEPVPDCDPSESEAFRESFNSNESNSKSLCIYAGHFTKYKTSDRRPGTCARPSLQMKIGQRTFSCSSGIMCQPFLFGLKSDDEPFCISPSVSATASCEEVSRTQGGKFNFLIEDNPGIEESWNEFAQNFKAICRKSQSGRQFFCSECQTMTRSLEMLNARMGIQCESYRSSIAPTVRSGVK